MLSIIARQCQRSAFLTSLGINKHLPQNNSTKLTIVTHADGSRESIAISRVCVCVCVILCVCLSG